MILVFDSGVWILAFRYGGPPLAAIDYAFKHGEIAMCDPIVAEIKRILARKFGWSEKRIAESRYEYSEQLIHVGGIGSLRGICRDPKDDIILECAAVAGAEVLITGDRDLLVIGSYQGVRILTVRGYLDTLTSAPL